MIIEDAYQTVLLPDGTLIPGLQPSLLWFNKIVRCMKGDAFEDKVVLDLGCCMSSYGIEAIKNGADYVTGIDSSERRIAQSNRIIKASGYDNIEAMHGYIESYYPTNYDIVIFGMVIHW